MTSAVCARLTLALTLTLALARAVSGPPSLGERGSELGLRMFQRMAGSWPRDNVLLSPYGVASVLGLLLPGADGNTRRQILHALHYYDNSLYERLGDLHRTLTKPSPGATVTVANGVFAQTGLEMKSAFLSAVRSVFQCESGTLDFSNTASAADAINSWVYDRTKGKISSLLRPDMLHGSLTRLVAVNAIYFKGLWKYPFRLQDTKPGVFTGDDGRKLMVPMMSQVSFLSTGTAQTGRGQPYTVLELPYEGDQLSLLLALPFPGTPLSALVPHVDAAAVRRWAGLLRPRSVQLSLPRFSVEAELDMRGPLSALGITDMFDRHRANFQHLCSEPLYVSKALQRAKMEVNEEGTKASVATAAVLLSRSSPLPVTVDRPFLFLIRHKPTGALLFVGQVHKP